MKLNHITLAVKDLETSLQFYQDITGLSLRRRFPAGLDTEIAFLGSGETEVELVCGKSAAHSGMEVGNGISLGFSADSLEDTIELLREKGYETDGVIMQPNPNMSFFFARDPNGINIQFIKNI